MPGGPEGKTIVVGGDGRYFVSEIYRLYSSDVASRGVVADA